jgi:predicted nicotinamide N-methyase
VENVYRLLQQDYKSEPFPYWARLWPSAIALATFIQKNPDLVAGKPVVEIGAGVGLPSLVAARFAKKVWCSDISEEAMNAAAKSAGLHQLKNIQFEACNWLWLPEKIDAEIVLLSDVNYDPVVFDELEKVLIALLKKGCTLFLATPQRLLAKPFLNKLSTFITDRNEEFVDESGQQTFVSIFVLKL